MSAPELTAPSGRPDEPSPGWPEGALFYSPLGLFEFQAEAVARTYCQLTGEEPVELVLYDTGIGKALRVDQHVATPEGWRTIGSLRPGALVMGPDGLPCSVTSVHPQGERPLFRVRFNDGAEVVCDEEHLWSVRSRSMKYGGWPWRTMTLRQIMARGLFDSGGGKRWFVPVTQPLTLPNRDLPLDPYLLGTLLGDGGLTQTTPHITSHGDDLPWVECVPAGVTVRQIVSTGRCPSYSLTTPGRRANPVTDALVGLGLMGHGAHDKFIPEQYLWASLEQRWALLQGLMDTDGSIYSTGIEFSTSSLKLAEGVVQLVQSLGGLASTRVRPTTHWDSYRLLLRLPQSEPAFRLKRKAERWRPRGANREVTRSIVAVEQVSSGDAVCIKVDRNDGLFLTEGMVVTHNTVVSLATAALMFEDNLLDLVVVVAEASKIKDWAEDDFSRFTRLSVAQYAGTVARRRKLLADPPQALVMTYETGRNDICSFKPRSKAVLSEGMLTEALRGRRVMVVFDEMTRLRSRQSKLYIAWDYLLNRALRRTETPPMVPGLTAGTVEKDPEDHFNACRLLAPWRACTVEEFYARYVSAYDVFGAPSRWKNLARDERLEPGVQPLSEMFAPITIRKRKTDPDVIAQFPRKVENPPRFVELGERHRDFYDAVEDMLADADAFTQRSTFNLMRQVAGHPASLLRSRGSMAQEIVRAVGERALLDMGAAKVEEMLAWARRMGDQQLVVFTFFGQSVLPHLDADLRRAGYAVSVNHGQMSQAERKRSQDAYKAGDTQIFLSSDAGARGLNLGVGSGLLHYELPLLHSIFVQRSNRIHRIDSAHPSVTIDSLVAAGTVEYPIAELMLRRNDWADQTVGDEGYAEDEDPGDQYLSAQDRRTMLRAAKRAAA